jgi:hypothetical protein
LKAFSLTLYHLQRNNPIWAYHKVKICDCWGGCVIDKRKKTGDHGVAVGAAVLIEAAGGGGGCKKLCSVAISGIQELL